MDYYIECRNVFDRKNISIFNAEDEVVANVVFHKASDEYQIEIKNILTNKIYYCKSNPLKIRKRYLVFDGNKKLVSKIGLGVKIIHSIIEADKYYFVKAAFWKIRYTVYDNRTVVSGLKIIRKNRKRFYKITMAKEDFVIVVSLFLLAQAVRMKSIII